MLTVIDCAQCWEDGKMYLLNFLFFYLSTFKLAFKILFSRFRHHHLFLYYPESLLLFLLVQFYFLLYMAYAHLYFTLQDVF